jgi:hypothetical protein
LYLIDEGVKNLRDPRLTSLSARGMKLFVCAYGCQQHGVPTADLDLHVSLCGLVVLSTMIEACDRFFAFTYGGLLPCAVRTQHEKGSCRHRHLAREI